MLQRSIASCIVSCLMPFSALAQGLDTGAHTLIEAAPGIYAVEPNFAGANAAVIINNTSVIVVDSHSSPASSATLIDSIRSVTDKPIRHVVNTHWHVDHQSGNESYRGLRDGDVSIISHDYTREDIPTLGREQYAQSTPYLTMPLEAAAEALEDVTLSDERRNEVKKFHDLQQEFVARGDAFEFTLPNLTISNSLTLHSEINSAQVLYLHPAHTRGDVVVYVPDQRILIVGDILTKPILWTWSSYPRAYVMTLKALETLDIDRILIGHGGPILEGKDYLTTVRQFMEAIVSFSTAAEASGTGLEQAVANGAADSALQAYRDRFVEDTEQENQMFDQMIAWTIERAYLEMQEN